jgi:hypothetical protein
VFEEPGRMLVEGGCLHSMNLVIEKAAATPEGPPPKKGAGSFLARWRNRTPFSVVMPPRRLGLILLGGSFQD